MTAAIASAEWTLPDRGPIAVMCLVVTEASLFTIFVAAYLYYMGLSLNGPYPRDVLEIPIWPSLCLLSSSIAVAMAERAVHLKDLRALRCWLAGTVFLGAEFLRQTALEWRRLITRFHLTIATNLFGTTYYSLVGLHASHVVIGLTLLVLALIASLRGGTILAQRRRLKLLAWYWHFVDAIWIVVFVVVYVIGR